MFNQSMGRMANTEATLAQDDFERRPPPVEPGFLQGIAQTLEHNNVRAYRNQSVRDSNTLGTNLILTGDAVEGPKSSVGSSIQNRYDSAKGVTPEDDIVIN